MLQEKQSQFKIIYNRQTIVHTNKVFCYVFVRSVKSNMPFFRYIWNLKIT